MKFKFPELSPQQKQKYALIAKVVFLSFLVGFVDSLPVGGVRSGFTTLLIATGVWTFISLIIYAVDWSDL